MTESVNNLDVESQDPKAHPWRKCPIGKHLVREHLVHVPPSKTHPGGHICAGVRWLFRKKQTASSLLHREATWEETVEDYKAILAKRVHGEPYNPKPMEDFRKYNKLLQGEWKCDFVIRLQQVSSCCFLLALFLILYASLLCQKIRLSWWFMGIMIKLLS